MHAKINRCYRPPWSPNWGCKFYIYRSRGLGPYTTPITKNTQHVQFGVSTTWGCNSATGGEQNGLVFTGDRFSAFTKVGLEGLGAWVWPLLGQEWHDTSYATPCSIYTINIYIYICIYLYSLKRTFKLWMFKETPWFKKLSIYFWCMVIVYKKLINWNINSFANHHSSSKHGFIVGYDPRSPIQSHAAVVCLLFMSCNIFSTWKTFKYFMSL